MGSKAPGCGEAALLPPAEVFSPKPQRFPPLIIYRLPDTKKPTLRVELFLWHKGNPRPILTSNI